MEKSEIKIRKLAGRLMLDIDPDQEGNFIQYFNDIIDFFKTMDEVKTEGQIQTGHIGKDVAPLREDEKAASMPIEKLAKNSNAFDPTKSLFRIQPVLEKPTSDKEEG